MSVLDSSARWRFAFGIAVVVCAVVSQRAAAQQAGPGLPAGPGGFVVIDATDVVVGLYQDGNVTSQVGSVVVRSPDGVLVAVEVRKSGFSPSTANRDLYFEGANCTGVEFLETHPPGHAMDPTLRLIQASSGIEPDGYTTFPDPSAPPVQMVARSFRNQAGCTNQLEPITMYGRPVMRVYLGAFVTPFRIE
jgi:hypothetical protein